MTRDEYAALVRAQVGDRYILGAEASPTNPDPSVFDCSELVEWSYARAGVVIPDGAYRQYDVSVPISGYPRIGDLAFLRNNPDRPNGIGHVGVVTGPNEIVEAKGKAYGVVLSTITGWEAKSTFAGIRRFPAFDQAMESGGADDMKLELIREGYVTLFRLYNPTLVDWLYTASQDEINKCLASGQWELDGRAFEIPDGGTVPLYRVLLPSGRHLMTTSEQEAALGKVEGTYMVGTTGPAVHRGNTASDAHIVTTSEAEARKLTYQGIAFYLGVPKPPVDTSATMLQLQAQVASLQAKIDKAKPAAKVVSEALA